MNMILIATDGSPSGERAVHFGVRLAREQEAEAVFVHVVPAYDLTPLFAFGMSGAIPHELTKEDRALLEAAARLAEQEGVRSTVKTLVGDAADEIVALADSIDAGMIVVGSRGHGAVAGTLLGSVAQGVLHEARRPVLVVPGLTHQSATSIQALWKTRRTSRKIPQHV
jgi:nucleotide-binding universal stress UspA family protein